MRPGYIIVTLLSYAFAVGTSNGFDNALETLELSNEGNKDRRYAPEYQYYPRPYYPQLGTYGAYYYRPVQPYEPYRPYQRNSPQYREPRTQPYYSKPTPENCRVRNIVEKVESTLGSVENAREGLNQLLSRLRYRRLTPFQFPEALLELAKTTTSMAHELRETMMSFPNSCATRSQSNAEESDGETTEDKVKERLIDSAVDLMQSAKSLESAIGALFKSPFKAFSNIEEVYSDLRNSLQSALAALTGRVPGTSGNDATDSSTDDGGFSDLTTFSDIRSSAPTSADDDTLASFTAVGPTTTNDTPSPTATSNAAWTRFFTFTAEDFFTFTNQEQFTVNQATYTRVFYFTTADMYRFTETSVFEEPTVTNAYPSPTSLPEQLFADGPPGTREMHTTPNVRATITSCTQ